MRGLRFLLLVAVTPLLGTSGCLNTGGKPLTPQGWDDSTRDAWYVADQGSRLIPQSWIDALEQPDGSSVGNGKFTDPAYLGQFNYIPANAYPRRDAATPADQACPIDQKLPLGFVTDCQDADARHFGVTKLQWLSNSKYNPREPWVGMNCAACHTNAIEFHYPDGTSSQPLLIDGAPTLADFQSFMRSLETALKNTYDRDQKFARFATAILPPDEAAADKPLLKQEMAKLIDWNTKLANLNADGGSSYGFGRLDAIGHIFNKVAMAALPDGTQTANPSDAPVSYPFLWNVPQLDHVQWNGIAPNIPVKIIGTEDFGALARNTGEVTGVFADLTLTPHAGWKGYVSSARIGTLDEMEQELRSLHAPAWPAQFPLNETTDTASPGYKTSVARGQVLFEAQCQSCHYVPLKGFDDTTERLQPTKLTPLSDVGTDMWMACNASFDLARAGAVDGDPVDVVGDGDKITALVPNLTLLRTAAVGTLIGQKKELIVSVMEGVAGLDNGLPKPPRFAAMTQLVGHGARSDQCNFAIHDDTDPHHHDLVYKGRALQGIWATAPYLHNGSVPSLYTLLLPPAQRPKTFCVGSHAFDPKEVGFEYQPKVPGAGNGRACPGEFEFDVVPPAGRAIDCKDSAGNAVICGNSNAGHDYNNAALSDDDRYALIEYMKKL